MTHEEKAREIAERWASHSGALAYLEDEIVAALAEVRTAARAEALEEFREILKPVADLADEIERCSSESDVPIEGWSTSIGWENVSNLRDAYRAIAQTDRELDGRRDS